VELLVVVGVIVTLMALAVPAFQAVRGSTDFGSEIYNIAGTFEQARAYAMANNTYVLAGIMEVSASQGSTVVPQTSGTGSIAIAVIASKTGARPYDINGLSNWPSIYNTGAATTNGGGFIAVSKLATFPSVHLVDLQNSTSIPPTSGNMERAAVSAAYNLSNAQNLSQNPLQGGATIFAWPLGALLAAPPQVIFQSVVEFDPVGSARVINTVNLDAIPHFIELGLEPAHGTTAAPPPANQNTSQLAAVQIDGISGAIRIYRP
jgi:type II secretory pathway pseudopilin PulG